MRELRGSTIASELDAAGYGVVEAVLDEARIGAVASALPRVGKAGSRLLLEHAACRELARYLRKAPGLEDVLGKLVAVECILFDKSRQRNWSIRLHRDELVPMRGDGLWPDAGSKEGLSFVKPARKLLDGCVAVRVQLDGAPEGDLFIVPGSHLSERDYESSDARRVVVGCGGVLAMRPTAAHSSARLEEAARRRVLHYLFAPRDLPGGNRWHYEV